MLSSERLEAYRTALDEVSEGAAEYLKVIFEEARKLQPDLTVAEWREFAIAAMQAAAETYGDMGAELACRLYDSQVAASGYSSATMPAALDRRRAEKVARYQAGKLVEGDFEGFERECVAFVSDHVREFANSTMTHNWERSARASSRYRPASVKAGSGGVRFARVPRGGETCTFCVMLASRGFVYWSRETAGEFNHYHRNCKCLVIPDDGSGDVYGYNPKEFEARWKAFEEIDARSDLTGKQRAALKKALSGDALLRTRADPALDYFGPAEEDDPDTLERIKADLKASGVEIVVSPRDREAISYGPSSKQGEPGSMHVTEGMSLSAWMHEYEHFCQDRNLGYPPSSYYFADCKLRISMEEEAYGVEIDRAVAHGYNELKEKLQELLDEETRVLDDRG